MWIWSVVVFVEFGFGFEVELVIIIVEESVGYLVRKEDFVCVLLVYCYFVIGVCVFLLFL